MRLRASSIRCTLFMIFFLWPRNYYIIVGEDVWQIILKVDVDIIMLSIVFIFDLGMTKKPVMKIRKMQRRQMKMRKSKYKNICLMFNAKTQDNYQLYEFYVILSSSHLDRLLSLINIALITKTYSQNNQRNPKQVGIYFSMHSSVYVHQALILL